MVQSFPQIGIHDGHNSSACLLVNGKVEFAIQEERFTRVKNQGGFPENSLNFIKNKFSLTDVVVNYAGQNIVSVPWEREKVKNGYRRSSRINLRALLATYTPAGRINQFRKKRLLRNKMSTEVTYHDHHQCHAAATYYSSEYASTDERVLVFTCDGSGDGLCATVSLAQNGIIKLIDKISLEHSLGRLYANVTHIMGFMPLEHEYKLMGMAPYAAGSKGSKEIEKEIAGWFRFVHGDTTWRKHPNIPNMQNAYNHMRNWIVEKRFDEICAGVQSFTESMLTTWIKANTIAHSCSTVALGGGVFMNVKANQKIMEMDEIQSIFVMPSCGDETNALGSAYLGYTKHSGQVPQPLKSMFLGDEYTNEEVLAAITQSNASQHATYSISSNINRDIAKLLCKNLVVARFAGRMEFGARSLGNRAILSNPSDPDAVSNINRKIKNRDFWMPFTPSILKEHREKFFPGSIPYEAKYMAMTFRCEESHTKKIQSVLHPADKTGRPQEVCKDLDADYYALINYFYKYTGLPLVLNTSFNLHGQPVVRTPTEAIEVFLNSGLDYLAMNDYLLVKNN